MKTVRKHLEKLRTIKKKEYHPLIHKIHKKHKISRKTLFYVKEYGPHTNVPRTIIKESAKLLVFASIISSFGGLALENIKIIFVSIMPLIILLPILNDMIGDFGTIVSSKFSTMLYENKVNKKWWINRELRKLFLQVIIMSFIMTLISFAMAFSVSIFSGYALNTKIILKIFLVEIIDVFLLVNILFLIAILAGIYFYKKKEDPNNFLIPITTSVADFGNMIILSALVILFF